MRVIPAAHRLELPRSRYQAVLALLHEAWVSGGMGPYRLAVAMSEIDLDFRCGPKPTHRRLCGQRV